MGSRKQRICKIVNSLALQDFRLIIDLNNINKSLWEYYIEAFWEDEFFSLSPLEQYESFRNSIFSNDVYFVDDIKAKPKLTKIEKTET